MRILVFAPYYPPHIGGLEVYAHQLNQNLAEQGFSITVFAPSLPSSAKEREELSAGLKIIRYPAFEIIANYPLPKFWNVHFWRLATELERERQDAVISHTRFFITSLMALVWANHFHKPLIHIEHGSDFPKLHNKLYQFFAWLYDQIFGKMVLRGAIENVAVSNAVSDFISDLLKKQAGKKRVIYRGFDIEALEKIPPDVSIRDQFPDKVILTFIGRLIDGKGIRDLLEALRNVKTKKIHCLIIGDGPEREKTKRLLNEFDLNERVSFLGYKTHQSAIAILKASDIFVNPSHTEGLPTSVIEAALCRRAIIATDVGGTREIITNPQCGILIRPRDIKGLAGEIETLAGNPSLMAKLGEKAYEENKDKFNWDICTSSFVKLIKESISKPK